MHHVYIIPGVVDEAVVQKQAYARANDHRVGPEPTRIHHHKLGELCNEECYKIEVGEQS